MWKTPFVRREMFAKGQHIPVLFREGPSCTEWCLAGPGTAVLRSVAGDHNFGAFPTSLCMPSSRRWPRKKNKTALQPWK